MIPTFNQQNFINQAVKSALDQDYKELNVIVSDDSTNDETKLLLQPYNSDTRFQYFKNDTSLGRTGNYRHLLNNLAQSEWVLMLDGDDYFIDATYITQAMQLVSQDPSIVLVGAGIKAFYQSKGKLEYYSLADKSMIIEGTEVYKYKKIPYHQTAVYQRNLACDLDFYRDPSMGSDSESLYRLCLHGKLAYLPQPVAVWRIHDQNTTFTRDLMQQVKELKFIDSIFKEARPHLDDSVAREWRGHMYKTMSLQLLNLSLGSKQYGVILKILSLYHSYLGRNSSLYYLKQMLYSFLTGLSANKKQAG